jgi:7-carboxy-7-deazaguanine synthase
MIVDWKLPGSGEYLNFGQRLVNLKKLDESSIWHAVKFVCKDLADIRTAHNMYHDNKKWQNSFLWYYGKVWDGDITDAELAEYVMRNKLPWRLNVQLHNYIWDPQERGR